MKHNSSPETRTKSDECNSEQEDDSSSTDEIEPKLKYERLANDVQNILQKDAVSCVAFHPKIICIGTRWGVVHLFDHQGNTIHNVHLRAHTVAVNQISMDSKGDFIATCSDDGKAYVYGLYTFDHVQELNLSCCVKSVAIDPLYYKLGVNRRFVTGDNQLVLHEKTFLSRIKSTTLHTDVGRVLNIKWHGRFIAWANYVGVRVYDIVSKTSLVLIKWNRSENVLPENFPCCLSWKNNVTLLIGWVDTVRVCKIERRVSVIKDMPEFVINPVSTFQIDYFVCGLCPLEASQLIILAYHKEKDENNKSLKPEMYLLQAENNKYVDVYTDNLTLRGYQDYIYDDYHLQCLVDENRFIIASPKDIVVASVYDFDDRIEWLVERSKFEEAMQLVTTKSRYLQHTSTLVVGKKYVDYLLSAKEYVKAAELCSKILGNDKELWETEVFKFARVHQLRAVSEYLPVAPDYQLNPHIYEMVMYEYLKMEPENFLKVIKKWSPTLYNIHAVINAVLEHAVKESNFRPVLLESLAILYAHSGQHDKALNMYLKLKHADVFQLIYKHNLYDSVHKEIENLMDLDTNKAINLFLEKVRRSADSSIVSRHEHDKYYRISADIIVSRLEHNQYYLYLYLDALDSRDCKAISKKFHAQLVKLYARFAPHKLLPLLRRSDTYPIQEALKTCKELDLYNEMVYLLGRIGNTQEALQLLITKIGDMEQAITFCKENDDPELWEELVEHSLSKPEFVSYLLQKIGNYVDPRILVQRIDSKMEIPELKTSLVKMLRDYNLQVSVEEGRKNIVVSDCFDMHKRLVSLQQYGFAIDDDLCCSVCQKRVLIQSSSVRNSVLVFYCRHSFHEECLPSNDATEKCIICCSQKGQTV